MAYGQPQYNAYMQKQREAIRNRLQRNQRSKDRVVGGGEILAGAAVAGVIQGKAGEGGAHILHLPASLVVGGLLIGGGVLQAGDWSDHLINTGTGFVAEFAGNWGYGVGQHWKQTGK